MGKFGKLLTVTAIAAATGAGVYYYLNKSQIDAAKKDDETDDGISGTGTTAQDSVAGFFKEKKEAIMNSREYVSLKEGANNAKDVLVKTVSEAAEKIKEKAQEAKDGVGVVDSEAKEKAEEFAFEEFDEEIAADVDANAAAEAPADEEE